uniref:SprB repeat-containing protein n=1 Tax=Neolewinella persica TaxID=70998 RepID=UPI0005C5F067
TFQGTSLTNEAEITEDDGDDDDSTPDNDVPTEDDQDDVPVTVEQTPSIDVEKSTFDPVTNQFLDADVFDPGTAPLYVWGVQDPVPTVVWQYVVTNDGTLDLSDVQVIDDQEGLIGVIPFLAAGASETLTASAPATISVDDPYMNEVTATGQPLDVNGDPTGPTVSDDDPSHYIGSLFNIEKLVLSDEICEGDDANYTVIIRLSGQQFGLNARMVMVTDTVFSLVSGTQDGFDLIPLLDPTSNPDGDMQINNGEEWTFRYMRTLTENTRNTAYEMFDIYRNNDFVRMVEGNSTQMVTVNPKPIILVADTDPNGSIKCFGDDDGSLTATITAGGTAPFTYSWSGGTQVPGEPETITGLSAGITYSVTVTDIEGCSNVASGILTEPTALTLSGTPVDVECNGAATGSIDITVGGGT